MSNLMLVKSYADAHGSRDWHSCELISDDVKLLVDKTKNLEQKLAKAVEGLKFYAEDFEIGRVHGFTVIRKAYSYDNFIRINERARQILKELENEN